MKNNIAAMLRQTVLACVVLMLCAVHHQAQTKQPALDYAKRVGVAHVKDKSTVCMTISNADLPRGAKVRLIFDAPGSRQTEAEAVIRNKRAGACNGDVSGSSHSYSLTLTKAEAGATNIAVAIVDYAKPFRREKNLLVADFNGDGRDEHLRSCTSSEGVHLSIRSTKARESKCVWHAYFYLGYDVEPTCTDEDCTKLNDETARLKL